MAKPYDTTDGLKHQCRLDFVAALHKHSKNPSHFFLLPSESGHDSRLLRTEFPNCSLRGVEKDSKVFARMDRSSGIIVENMSVHTWVTTVAPHLKPHHFDGIFFDYEGFASPTNVADICEFVSKDHLIYPGKPTVIAMTFGKYPRTEMTSIEQMVRLRAWLEEHEEKRRDGWNTPLNVAGMVSGFIDAGMPDELDPPLRRISAPPIKRTHPLRSQLRRLEIIHAVEYQCNETSRPMFFIILVVEKFSKE